MSENLLLSSRIKVERAKQHFNDLQSRIEAFSNRNPYKVIVDRNSEPAINVHRLQITEPIPVLWSAIIGDLLHNLMSAMDALTALVKRAGFEDESILQETYFPIHWSENDFGKRPKTINFVQRVGPDVEKLVRRLQPYKSGYVLGRLKSLDIQDKHRAIIPVWANLRGITTGPGPIQVHSVSAKYPLKDGDELMRTAFFEGHFEAQANFIFQISIDGETELTDGVRQYVEFVERTVKLFGWRFFQPR